MRTASRSSSSGTGASVAPPRAEDIPTPGLDANYVLSLLDRKGIPGKRIFKYDRPLRMDLSTIFPGRERFPHPPSRDDLPLASFQVVHVAPAADEPHAYVTEGASEHGHEFLVLSRRAFFGHVDLLTSVAYFQSFYGLDEGSIYKFARGYFPGSPLNRLLVSARKPVAGFAWLVPITEDEERFARAHGAGALEERLAAADVLAESRASVA